MQRRSSICLEQLWTAPNGCHGRRAQNKMGRFGVWALELRDEDRTHIRQTLAPLFSLCALIRIELHHNSLSRHDFELSLALSSVHNWLRKEHKVLSLHSTLTMLSMLPTIAMMSTAVQYNETAVHITGHISQHSLVWPQAISTRTEWRIQWTTVKNRVKNRMKNRAKNSEEHWEQRSVGTDSVGHRLSAAIVNHVDWPNT